MGFRLLKCQIILVLTCFCLTSVGQTLQNSKEKWEWLEEATKEDPYKYAGQFISFKKNLEESVIAFLNENYNELSDSRAALKLVSSKRSPIGNHLLFYQTFNSVKIYGSEVKVNLREGQRISSLFASMVNTKSWSDGVTDAGEAPVSTAEKVIFYDGNSAEGAWYYEIHNDANHHHIKVVQRQSGEAFVSGLERNKRGGPKDTLVWVYVFNPDPLTTAGVIYGAPYVDAQDADIDELNAERQLQQVKMSYLSDSIWAENKYVKLISEDVNFDIPWSRTDTFDYDRGEDAFEFIMAIYHISTYKEYLNSIGFDSIMNYQIRVKPRAFADDNSNFLRSINSEGEGVLSFGNSSKTRPHVDDAEDADVLIHEYAHAISYNVNLNELDGAGRRAIDEGLCDYFAASHSKSLNDFRYKYVYSWDGHNPFWEGRFCFTDKTYNDYSANKTIYQNGEIYASVFTDVHDAIGREVTDKILISSMFEYADKMPFKSAAELFIKAELELYKGQYHDTICSILRSYEFVNEEFCKTGINGTDGFEKNIVVDKVLFANSSSLSVKFNSSFTGNINILDASGKLLYAENVRSADNFYTPINCRKGVYLVVFNDGWNLYTEKLIR